MTNWLPELQKSGNPLYIELADTIERDIDSGKLPVGSKLPPQRNIAFDIGVTVGTISRGYALACERGLVSGEIGRGTYVLEREGINPVTPPSTPNYIRQANNATTNRTPDRNIVNNLVHSTALDVGQPEIIAELAARIAIDNPEMTINYIPERPARWKEAGQEWLSIAGWKPDLESIVSTNGSQSATNAIIAALTLPGDKVVFEGLSYTPAARSVAMLGRRVILVEFDEDGIIPESFESVCAQQHPKVLYLMPSVQNPTLARLPQDRREAIAEIAHRYNVWIIEDCIYTAITGDPIKPISYYAPDRTFYIGGLSKSMAAGIRAGWVSCPPQLSTRIATAHNLCMGASSYWLAELSSKLVHEGHADTIRQRVKEGISQRTSIIRQILGNHDYNMLEYCPYLWLKLPDPWNSGTFQNALAKQGILVSDEDQFKPVRSNQVFHAARIAFSSITSIEELNKPFEKIRDVLESGIPGHGNTN
jgi:DNA-binding transcriptional MocR family regulator